MLLREFVYFNETDTDQQKDRRYDPKNDQSLLDVNSTRKTRLTLKMINRLRAAGEARAIEAMEDQALIRIMYANPPAEPAAGAPPVF